MGEEGTWGTHRGGALEWVVVGGRGVGGGGPGEWGKGEGGEGWEEEGGEGGEGGEKGDPGGEGGGEKGCFESASEATTLPTNRIEAESCANLPDAPRSAAERTVPLRGDGPDKINRLGQARSAWEARRGQAGSNAGRHAASTGAFK